MADPDRDAGAQPPSFLIVDDDRVFRERLARAFRDRGFDVRTAANGAEALELARDESPEFAVAISTTAMSATMPITLQRTSCTRRPDSEDLTVDVHLTYPRRLWVDDQRTVRSG